MTNINAKRANSLLSCCLTLPVAIETKLRQVVSQRAEHTFDAAELAELDATIARDEASDPSDMTIELVDIMRALRA